MKKFLFGTCMLFVIIICVYVLVKFNQNKNTQIQTNKIVVITTLFPLYDIAKNIGQDKVEVTLLLPPGVEAHSFEPKPSDIVKINKADIFVYTGKFMEPWAEDIIKGISGKDVKIINSSIGVKMAKEEESGHKDDSAHYDGGFDPHIWLDFDNAKIMVDNFTKIIIEKDPVNIDYYQKNADEYKNQLTKLDDDYKNTLANCKNNTIIYGGHYTFGYLASRYNLKYLSTQGISPNTEPNARDLIQLVKQIKKDNIEYIFYEELASSKIAETLVNETKTRMLLLNGAHNLTKEDFKNKVSFFLVMRDNLNNFKVGLQCLE